MPGIPVNSIISFKSSLSAVMQPLKLSLMSIRLRIDVRVMSDQSERMAAVNDCISCMISYVDVVINNADVYYDGGFHGCCIIVRKISNGKYGKASDDINNIGFVAVKCIEIIDNHNRFK